MVTPPRTPRRAFTIIELLVVIAIIGILISLGLYIAGKVSGSGKQRVTEQTLRALDSALASYIAVQGEPPAFVAHPWDRNENVLIPVIDGRNWTFTDSGAVAPERAETVNNSVGLFMLQCKDVPTAAKALDSLDPKIVKLYDPLTSQGRGQAQMPNSLFSFSGPGQPPMPLRVVPPLSTALDGWGHPIRYVHPAFQGIITTDPASTSAATEITITAKFPAPPANKSYAFTQLRRADGSFSSGGPFDADGGMSPAKRGYFYSCGPDGDPTTIEDNVYLTKPRFVSK